MASGDAGYDDGIDAVVNMIVARLRFIIFLNAPYFPELCRSGTLDYSYGMVRAVVRIVKERFEVESGIFSDESDARSLSAAEAFWHALHGEAVVFLAPIVEFEPQFMAFADAFVFRHGSAGAYLVGLFSQVFNRVFPCFHAL